MALWIVARIVFAPLSAMACLHKGPAGHVRPKPDGLLVERSSGKHLCVPDAWVRDQLQAAALRGEMPLPPTLELVEAVKRLDAMGADDTRTGPQCLGGDEASPRRADRGAGQAAARAVKGEDDIMTTCAHPLRPARARRVGRRNYR